MSRLTRQGEHGKPSKDNDLNLINDKTNTETKV